MEILEQRKLPSVGQFWRNITNQIQQMTGLLMHFLLDLKLTFQHFIKVFRLQIYVHIEIVSISDKITWNIFESSSNMFIQHFKWKMIWKSDKINIPNYNTFLRENIKGNSEALMLFDQTKKKFCQKFLWLIN